jgi:hypothetical protein
MRSPSACIRSVTPIIGRERTIARSGATNARIASSGSVSGVDRRNTRGLIRPAGSPSSTSSTSTRPRASRRISWCGASSVSTCVRLSNASVIVTAGTGSSTRQSTTRWRGLVAGLRRMYCVLRATSAA